MNQTVELIVSRLPRKPILNAREVADALGLQTTAAVVSAVEDGRLQAAKVGNQYRISRDAAAKWIREMEAAL